MAAEREKRERRERWRKAETRESKSNVPAAIASLVLPGFGQLLQGRVIDAIGYLLVVPLLGILIFCFIWYLGLAAITDTAADVSSDDYEPKTMQTQLVTALAVLGGIIPWIANITDAAKGRR